MRPLTKRQLKAQLKKATERIDFLEDTVATDLSARMSIYAHVDRIREQRDAARRANELLRRALEGQWWCNHTERCVCKNPGGEGCHWPRPSILGGAS